jgi:hypothetical protein
VGSPEFKFQYFQKGKKIQFQDPLNFQAPSVKSLRKILKTNSEHGWVMS